jgi:hypothetical protein
MQDNELSGFQFRKEENGVKWFVRKDGPNTVHRMQFEGMALIGSWVGPRWVFSALVSMSPAERGSYDTHDEYMCAINQTLRARNV